MVPEDRALRSSRFLRTAQSVGFILALKVCVYCVRLLLELDSLKAGEKKGMLDRWQALPVGMRPRGLYDTSSSQPPLSLADLPADALLQMVLLVLPAYLYFLAPIHIFHVFAAVHPHPALRRWFAAHDTTFMAVVLLAEFSVMGAYTDWVVWSVTHRILVWPSIAVVSSSVCDILAHYYVTIHPISYAALMTLKWTTLNLPVFFLPAGDYDAWSSLFSTVVSVGLCVSTPVQQRLAARKLD